MRILVRDMNGNTLASTEADIAGELYDVSAYFATSDLIVVKVDFDPDPDEEVRR